MDKQQLLAWIQSLPEDIEAIPFEISEISEERDDWVRQPDLVGHVFSTVYQQKVRTQMTLRLNCTGTIQGEFERDRFGNPRWANVRDVKYKKTV